MPTSVRQPRSLRIDDDDPKRRAVVYRFGDLDRDFPPASVDMTTEQFEELHVKLAGYESQTVNEIWGPQTNGCHMYEVEELPDPSAKRLTECERDDATRLHSLRVNGKYRVIGILRANIYYLLWIDPEHEVWPSQKRNT